MLTMFVAYLVPIIIAFLVLVLILNSLVVVRGDGFVMLERKWFGKSMPAERTVALKDEVGVQARTLGPGMHWLKPFIYKTKKDLFHIVLPGQVGYVDAITGKPIQEGRIMATPVDCDMFQDGEAFLKNGGQKGPQTQILPPGNYRINKQLFKVLNGPVESVSKVEVGLVESIDGTPVPQGKIFAKSVACNDFQDAKAFLANGEKGVQIPVLPQGDYRINPLLFKVKKVPTTIIEQGEIGVVTAMDGLPIDKGRLLGKTIAGHSNFEDGEAFLKNGGQRGPQADILLPGTYRINTNLFKVVVEKAKVVPAKKVGLVTAKDGKPLPETEYVAISIEGHDNFQNISKFLENGGQRGPQFDILKPGTYYINPLMFDVDQDDVAQVERGQVAVIISNVGKEHESIKQAIKEVAANENKPVDTENLSPEALKEAVASIDRRLDVGIERYVVPKGYRGIQQEFSGPGTYYLNRRAFIAYIVDTTNITIDWDEAEKTVFDPLKVISHDGFEISVSVKVVIRVRPDQAPYMIAKIGSIDNLINHVIHPMIDSSFRNQASSTSAMNFMQNRHEEQKKAEDRARLELENYHVELVNVLICQINLPEELMLTQTKRIIAEQKRTMYTAEQQTEEIRIAKEKTTAQADKQRDLVAAEIDVQIADQNKQKAIKQAEGKKEATILEKTGEAEGDLLIGLNQAKVTEAQGKAKGSANAAEGEGIAKGYEAQKKAIGENAIVTIEVAKNLSGSNLKLVPDFLIQSGENGGSGIGELLSTFLVKNITKKQPGDSSQTAAE